MAESPYLKYPHRLSDVIAAIQAMGEYKFYKLDFGGWADRIEGNEARAQHWKTVIEQHPEFFRMDSKREKASLVWRRQRQKMFDVDTSSEITRAAFHERSEAGKARVSRMPLRSGEVAVLIDVAIKLHATALERQKDRRWWIPVIASLLAVIFGAMVTLLVQKWSPKMDQHESRGSSPVRALTSPSPSP